LPQGRCQIVERAPGSGRGAAWIRAARLLYARQRSDRLEQLEGLVAGVAVRDRLARRGAELAPQLGAARVAERALRRLRTAPERNELSGVALHRPRRRDPVRLELRARLDGDPLRGPGGREDGAHAHAVGAR